jgi:hypothetical protein
MRNTLSSKSPVSKDPVQATAIALPEDSFSTGSTLSEVDVEFRDKIIAEKAYFMAEARGFASGYEVEDWLAAEAEVNQFFGVSYVNI